MFLTKEKTLANKDIILKAESRLEFQTMSLDQEYDGESYQVRPFKISIYEPRETKYGQNIIKKKFYHFVY